MRGSALAALLVAVTLQPAAAEHSVRVVQNLTYAPDHPGDSGKLDLYLPEGVRNFPVLISLYGGGLMNGSKDEEAHIGRRFASAGIGTVVINYRLSPAVSHPAHIQDVAAAVDWAKRHIAEYGGSPDDVFVMGHSAGGYMTGLIATDPKYLAAHGLSLRDIRGAIPVSGFFYVDRVAPDRPKHIWGESPEAWLEASPAKYVTANLPPMLVLYAEKDADWRRAQNDEFGIALGHAANDVTIRQVNGLDHAGIWESLGADGEASRLVLEFIARNRSRAGS